jgi:hypothetical protein
MATSPSNLSSVGIDHGMSTNPSIFIRATRSIRAVARAAVFFLKVFPMLPSRPVDWVTTPPLIEKVRYPTHFGLAEGDLYRPSTGGPHPGIVVCLGVVPFGVDHPQVPRLGKALARAGFAALLYWSPAMRDFRLDPDDIESIALAYRWFSEQPFVDPARSGLLGTCVGGAFALMAAASPLIRERVNFIGAYAPYASMWTFARDIASATRSCGEERQPWQVDPLTRKVFIHSLTALLEPDEAERFRSAFVDLLTEHKPRLILELHEGVSRRAILDLLTSCGYDPNGKPISKDKPVSKSEDHKNSEEYHDNWSYLFLPKNNTSV